MKVIEVNEGTKVSYETKGTKITFADELMLNIAKYEQDNDVSIDICADKNGNLTTAPAFRYVAQIEIPARQYKDEEVENPSYDESDETSNKTITNRVPVAFSMDNVTLRLYSLD